MSIQQIFFQDLCDQRTHILNNHENYVSWGRNRDTENFESLETNKIFVPPPDIEKIINLLNYLGIKMLLISPFYTVIVLCYLYAC